MNLNDLKKYIIHCGERLPKKHGAWYRAHVYDDNYLVLDTWNGFIYHYPNGATPTDTDNLYRVVYTFEDKKGMPDNYRKVPEHMADFWYAHIRMKGCEE